MVVIFPSASFSIAIALPLVLVACSLPSKVVSRDSSSEVYLIKSCAAMLATASFLDLTLSSALSLSFNNSSFLRIKFKVSNVGISCNNAS